MQSHPGESLTAGWLGQTQYFVTKTVTFVREMGQINLLNYVIFIVKELRF